jgi:hypothetical protein
MVFQQPGTLLLLHHHHVTAAVWQTMRHGSHSLDYESSCSNTAVAVVVVIRMVAVVVVVVRLLLLQQQLLGSWKKVWIYPIYANGGTDVGRMYHCLWTTTTTTTMRRNTAISRLGSRHSMPSFICGAMTRDSYVYTLKKKGTIRTVLLDNRTSNNSSSSSSSNNNIVRDLQFSMLQPVMCNCLFLFILRHEVSIEVKREIFGNTCNKKNGGNFFDKCHEESSSAIRYCFLVTFLTFCGGATSNIRSSTATTQNARRYVDALHCSIESRTLQTRATRSLYYHVQSCMDRSQVSVGNQRRRERLYL